MPCKHCPYISRYRLLVRDPVPRSVEAERKLIAEAIDGILASGEKLPVDLGIELCHMSLPTLTTCSGYEWLQDKLAKERPALTYD